MKQASIDPFKIIRESLDVGEINEHGWLDYDSFVKIVPKIRKSIRKDIRHLFDTNDLVIFLNNAVIFGIKDRKLPSEPRTLSDSEKDNIAIELVRQFATFPRKYQIIFSLPLVKTVPDNFILGIDKLGFDQIINKKSKFGIIDEKMFDWKDNFYLVLGAEGYIDDESSESFLESLGYLKQFLYFSKIDNKIETRFSIPVMTSEAFVVDTENSVVRRIRISEAFAEFLGKIKFNNEFLTSFSDKKANTGLRSLFEHGPPTCILRTKFKNIIESANGNPNTSSIKNALEWGVDGEIEPDRTIAFVKVAVALEAVLGTNAKKENLVNQLADRCAYLIGKNVVDRESVRSNFKKFYEVRSELIHGSQRKLPSDKLEWFHWAQQTLNQVIYKESNTIM